MKGANKRHQNQDPSMIYRVLPQNLATNSLMCHHQGRNCSGTAEGTLESELHILYMRPHLFKTLYRNIVTYPGLERRHVKQ